MQVSMGIASILPKETRSAAASQHSKQCALWENQLQSLSTLHRKAHYKPKTVPSKNGSNRVGFTTYKSNKKK